MNEELKNIITESLKEILNEYKGNIKDFLTDTIVPATDAAVKDFQDEQKAESAASSSAWVKIRNSIINGAVGIVYGLAKSVVLKIFEKAEQSA